jgi:hypothetical protein
MSVAALADHNGLLIDAALTLDEALDRDAWRRRWR